MNQQEQFNALVLSRISYFQLAGLLELYKMLGSATEVMTHRAHLRDVLPDASDKLIDTLSNLDEPMRRAEEEMHFCEEHHIQILPFNDPTYPQRLSHCVDAPIALFYRGTTDLNARHIINIVGTRHATAYGVDIIRRFVADLRSLCPDVIIVSGLAYGVDITAHRAALQNNLETVGVLAHGLDEIYPRAHRDTAIQMVGHGGLLTEYMSHTRADKMNFVRRNRIVAGCTDATILVESADKGGGLITCGIARSYDREVFAFPGNVGAKYSEGCNRLIRTNMAGLITGAADLAEALGWEDEQQRKKARKKGVERNLFPQLNETEQQIVDVLKAHNDLPMSFLSAQSGLTISQLSAHLFEMEMKGIIRTLAGGTYHLID